MGTAVVTQPGTSRALVRPEVLHRAETTGTEAAAGALQPLSPVEPGGGTEIVSGTGVIFGL